MKIVVFEPSEIHDYEIGIDGITKRVTLKVGSNYVTLLEDDAAKFTIHVKPIDGMSKRQKEWLLKFGRVGVLTGLYFSL